MSLQTFYCAAKKNNFYSQGYSDTENNNKKLICLMNQVLKQRLKNGSAGCHYLLSYVAPIVFFGLNQ
jgi:hypothetical protein